ncbi:MAG: hypothetical protein DRI44_08480 [Chlamydiae bacterium]|nr:MAG: hypothetical protein DRI44_08480 [Chlamydiota bacterium]
MKKLIFTLIVIASYPILSATFYVDINGSQSYSNIQDAINNAPIGGWTEIYVYPGVYHENLLVNTNQHLLLSSTNELSEVVRNATIIDGDAAGSVITILGTKLGWQSGTTCTVAGVTITNGAAATGGGIYGSPKWSSPINYINIRRCLIAGCNSTSNNYDQGGGAIAYTLGSVVSNKIVNNYAVYGGGGLYRCLGGVSYNLIANNIAGMSGGGMYYINNDIFHNVISNNTAQSNNGGGMIYINGTFAYNLVTRNYSGQSGGGGYALRSIKIYNNEFSFNVAGNSGGGICNSSASQANNDLINNLICNNIASNSGGGICYFDDSFALNNTIAGNYGQNYCGGVYFSPNTFWINNIIIDNVSDNAGSSNIVVEGNAMFYNCCLTDVNNIDASNISSDPQFVTNNNYRLKPTSPCINAGLSNMFYSMLPWHDLDGKLRNQNGVDIGCYESGTLSDHDGDLLVDADEPALLANSNKWDTNGDGFSDGMSCFHNQIVTNNLTNVTFYVSAGESIQAAMAFAVPGDSINISPGEFKELIIPYFGVQISGATNSAGENQTIINGEGKRSVFYNFHHGIGVSWDMKNVLANLIITNGNEYLGGGIFSLKSLSAYSINNCDFVNNHAEKGGAIASPKKNPETSGSLENCNFIGNSAQNAGGAIYNMIFSDNIQHCLFINNSASNGAAISRSSSVIDRCIFSNNTATIYGGAVYETKKDIRNSLFVNNSAQKGGALAAAYYYSLDIQNNTFCKNHASESGGAIYETSKKYDFFNNIVWNNTASNNAQIYLDVASTNYFNNAIQDWTWMQNNNLSNYPDFTDFANDNYHLQTNSYCIDSGTNTPREIYSWFDLDDSYRVVGYYVDRGCYEFYNTEDEIDYDNGTNRLIIILQPPGGGKIIKKVVIYKLRPCESNKRVRISQVSYPIPNFRMGDTVKNIVTADDNTTFCSGGDWPESYYMAPGSKMWTTVYMPGFSYLSDVFPRDGYPGYYGGIYNTSKSGSSGWGVALNTPDGIPITATLPVHYLVMGIAMPNDASLLKGEGSDSNVAFWVAQPDPADPFSGNISTIPITQTLPFDYAPAYVDEDGTKNHSTYENVNDVNYDSDKIWAIDNTSGDLALQNIKNGAMMTMTTPLTGGGDYLIGSFPDGLAVAEKNTKTLYTYVYDPTTPASGNWCTDYFEYVITKLGYSTSRRTIPEPFIALMLYFFGTLALYKIIRKQ